MTRAVAIGAAGMVAVIGAGLAFAHHSQPSTSGHSETKPPSATSSPPTATSGGS